MNARRGVIPLIAVIVGLGLMAWSFLNGIAAALDGSGTGALGYQVIFIASAVLVLASLVIAVINLVRGDSRVLAIITIIVAFLPIVGAVVFAIAANQPYPGS
ncbi:putative Tic20 family protein [Leifsonia sp. AK011]|uniref:hypothetical protein n=1 Tax=Leifsonia sp. AK011 TaxID=2723075 RepID=UPI0015C79D7E|nr:hypothetical protein [Leifsonia sp. AK011]NYF11266.1 putative Tic20 family protein [Leifsonia sp. AK011]